MLPQFYLGMEMGEEKNYHCYYERDAQCLVCKTELLTDFKRFNKICGFVMLSGNHAGRKYCFPCFTRRMKNSKWGMRIPPDPLRVHDDDWKFECNRESQSIAARGGPNLRDERIRFCKFPSGKNVLPVLDVRPNNVHLSTCFYVTENGYRNSNFSV